MVVVVLVVVLLEEVVPVIVVMITTKLRMIMMIINDNDDNNIFTCSSLLDIFTTDNHGRVHSVICQHFCAFGSQQQSTKYDPNQQLHSPF